MKEAVGTTNKHTFWDGTEFHFNLGKSFDISLMVQCTSGATQRTEMRTEYGHGMANASDF